MDPFEQPPSPLKNFLGGGGCGCGCIGLLMVLVASVFMGALYMNYLLPTSYTTVMTSSMVGAAFGLLLFAFGVLLWVASIMVD